jgi:hypothetical protein
VPFDQVFPFFMWQVAEVDYARFKATGVTVTVDAGGDVRGGPYAGLLNPQVQPGGALTRTETGPVLTQAYQGFAGQTSIFEWGKKPYEPGENGGISGIVYYASTRGENDPRLTVGDPWEPGIPRVKVRLYREVATSTGGKALALVQEVQTDSWDDAVPTECPGEIPGGDPFVDNTLGGANVTRCYDGFRNWNQARPGVFDGGYAFNDIPPGKYVVEVLPPPGYELYKEEDKNVDFGDSFATLAPVAMMLPGGGMVAAAPDQAMVLSVQGAEPGLAQPPCVGPDHLVPSSLSLFPGVETYAPFAGTTRPLCNQKAVILSDQGQAAADFHLFTSTPAAAQFAGLLTDDIAVETNPASPGYGEKFSPSYLPFSMRDFNGRELYRGYSDAFGHYNGVVPSTVSANIPMPSGYSPNMILTCLNDPGNDPIAAGWANPNYGPACYTLQFMPAVTTYLDTPMLPKSAFAAGWNPVDCAFPDKTPVIKRVNGSGQGPWIDNSSNQQRTLNISSAGDEKVPNPAYEGPLAQAPYNQATVTRDFGFGATTGTVTIGGTPLTVTNWNNSSITATVPADATTGELVVTRGDNLKASINTVTVTVSTETVPVTRVAAGGSIQTAIDAALPGSLILVAPGVYEELVVMWKPIRLQGSGASTIINAVKSPNSKLEAWYRKVKSLVGDGVNGAVDLLPGQPAQFDLAGGGLLANELGAGITVLAKNDDSFSTNPSRIDGFKITGADGGGGIFVNGYAHGLEIANNSVTGNSGVLHGGIRVGHSPFPNVPDPIDLFGYNRNLNIHHNAITLNGGLSGLGTGGGLSLCTGTDNYTVSRNFICGNFKLGDGAGIGHLGLSSPGLIEFNQILFNQSFNQGVNRSGGGVLIAGEPAAVGALTLGAGNVTVNANLIQGNQAGSGHGGGIRTQSVNGEDASGLAPDPWRVLLTNNMIVNNVAGWSGAGISLQDTIAGSIINNTVSDNDSTATVGGLIVGNVSTPQPAGISAERHSLALAAVPSAGLFSNPTLVNNIVWHNRAFSYDAAIAPARLKPELTAAAVGACGTGAIYWDLGVLGDVSATPGDLKLNPTYSILSNGSVYDISNLTGDPAFLKEYCNGARTLRTPWGPMQVAAAGGEGGNFIDVRYGPLTQAWPAGSAPWDYHIGATSAGFDNGTGTGAPNNDFDNQARSAGLAVDRGADELAPSSPQPGTVVFSSGAFGNVSVNTTKTLTITATVSVASVAFSSSTSPAAPFAKTTDTCAGTTVPIGGTCTFTVTYTPTAATTSTGSFTVTSNAVGSPQAVSLTGTGVIPRYSVRPLITNFGNQRVGVPSAVRNLTVTNCVLNNAGTNCTAASPGTLVFNGAQVATITGGANSASAFFALVAPTAGTPCTTATVLNSGQACTIGIRFTPTSLGAKGTQADPARVNILVASGVVNGNNVSAGVFGTGVQGTVSFTASSPGTLLTNANGRTLEFGNRTGIVPSTMTIANTGTAPVTYGLATVSNLVGTAFSLGTNNCTGTTRNPGQTCQIQVIFNAGLAGDNPRTGTLSVPTVAPNTATNNPAVLNLTGR